MPISAPGRTTGPWVCRRRAAGSVSRPGLSRRPRSRRCPRGARPAPAQRALLPLPSSPPRPAPRPGPCAPGAPPRRPEGDSPRAAGHRGTWHPGRGRAGPVAHGGRPVGRRSRPAAVPAAPRPREGHGPARPPSPSARKAAGWRRGGSARQLPAPRCPDRGGGGCCLPDLASVRAAPAAGAGDKARGARPAAGGGRQERGGRPGPPPPGLASPGLRCPGRPAQERRAGRAGRCRRRRGEEPSRGEGLAPPQPAQVTVRGEGRSLRGAGASGAAASRSVLLRSAPRGPPP